MSCVLGLDICLMHFLSSNVQKNTVDSRYLELQGTLWNTSRYPYFDISDLRNWGKQLIVQHLKQNEYVIWLLS